MRSVRNALLAGIIAVLLPVHGLTSQVLTVAMELKNSLVRGMSEASGDFSEPGIRIRSAPGTAAAVRGTGNPGDRIRVRGRSAGPAVTCPNGSANSEWVEITDRRTGVSGFVSACYL
ncbi:SH3 domain-containing protein [Saccharopolyspora rosea]|uniref:SH3 domain-containing protein n=1 Tax=Saccharopolyspora rosea TaxID=524884 RepID=A0ABW3FRY1_9PSEU|nr:SH3 domain-containing protein [Saccharopolyspora rosea]